MPRLFIIIALVSFFTATAAFAQDSTSQNLYFVRKHKEAVFNAREYQPGKGKAFYIYRNCIYKVVLKNKLWVSMRVVDIRNDSIYYTPHVSNVQPKLLNNRTDTLALHPGQFRKLKLIGDRAFGLFANYSFRGRRHVFEKGDTLKGFKPESVISYSQDSSRSVTYELVPYLTLQGIDLVYEQKGITYYYEGIKPRIDEDTIVPKKPLSPKKGVWFTPTNVNKISGVNLGIQTMTLADNDRLTIHGVNINADLLSMFASMYAIFHILNTPHPKNYPDEVDKSKMTYNITGLSLSGGGLTGDMRVRGLSINGGICMTTEVTGLHITGISNTTGEFKGVVISGLCNRSIKGRGLQLSLLNHCKNLKGFQLGLWNVNSKRALPFINWDL